MARYRCSLNRLPRTQKKLPASAGYRGSDLVHWHIASFRCDAMIHRLSGAERTLAKQPAWRIYEFTA